MPNKSSEETDAKNMHIEKARVCEWDRVRSISPRNVSVSSSPVFKIKAYSIYFVIIIIISLTSLAHVSCLPY